MRVLRWPGNILRAFWVGAVIVACLIIYGLGRLGTLFRRNTGARRAAVARLRGKILRRGMTMLGATFVKMGQVMSSRPDLFDDELIAELRRLQDKLPPFAFWRARRILERDLGRPLTEIFSEFDRQPVAAASVAQVHRAVLRESDTEVAVKVLRPGIRRQVERDAAMLLFGARVLALHPGIRLHSDPVGHLSHFVSAIIDQTDLTKELANYARFRENFAGFSGVSFPQIHEQLSGRDVLTMQFIHGTKIDELPAGEHPEVAEVSRNAFMKMVFEDGFLHADLHPGNMMVKESGELVILDVGLAKQLDPQVLTQPIDMTKCLVMGTPKEFVDHFRRFHVYMHDVDWDALTEDVAGFVEYFRAKSQAEVEYTEMFAQMFTFARKYRLRPVTDLTLVMVAIVTAQGIGVKLAPELDVFAEMARYLVPLMVQRGETIPESPEAERAFQA